MIRDFSKEELEPVESERDTEITLGGNTVLVLGGGLLFLCVVCFGIGYMVGHRSSSESATAVSLPSNSKASARPAGSGSKPGAAGQAPARPQSPKQRVCPASRQATRRRRRNLYPPVPAEPRAQARLRLRPIRQYTRLLVAMLVARSRFYLACAASIGAGAGLDGADCCCFAY